MNKDGRCPGEDENFERGGLADEYDPENLFFLLFFRQTDTADVADVPPC